jgi:coenzyme F420 hydrogenase subunit beta
MPTSTMNNTSIANMPRLNLCTGCGTCAGICPTDAITMLEDYRGIYIPQVEDSKCNNCNLCLQICPGYYVDFKELNLSVFNQIARQEIVGNVLGSYLSYSQDEHIRAQGQSGGLVSSLLIFALKNKIIDGAVVTRMSRADPLRPETFIATSEEEILEASKSKYCPVPAGTIIKDILNREGRFAFIGLSCQIHGIRKTEQVNKKLKGKIILHIGLFCNKTLSFHFQKYILSNFKIKIDEVEKFTYRDKEWHGWPGDIQIKLKSGVKKDLQKDWRMSAKPIFTPQRCYLCFDQLNQLADISVGDPWLPVPPKDVNKGFSVVITRSEIGEELILQMKAKGKIHCNEIPLNEILEGQAIERRKIQTKAYLEAFYGLKGIKPTFNIEFFDQYNVGRKARFAALIDLLLSKCYTYAFRGKTLRYVPTIFLRYASALRNILALHME